MRQGAKFPPAAGWHCGWRRGLHLSAAFNRQSHNYPMKIFGLSTRSNTRGASSPRSVTWLPFAMCYAGLSFGAVSTLAYSIWAFRWVPGTTGLYVTTALVYIGLGGLALSRLIAVRGAWRRFPLCFATVFLVYAVLWCAFWFGLRGKYQADLFGALAGLAAMTWLLQRAFGQTRGFLGAFVVLLALHSVGYYAGGYFHSIVPGVSGKLLWGAAHGVGFGSGLGYVLHQCQWGARAASQ